MEKTYLPIHTDQTEIPSGARIAEKERLTEVDLMRDELMRDE